MNIGDLMDDLGTALETIDGLRVFPYVSERVMPPAAVVKWPDSLIYDETMGRGGDRIEIPVVVLVGQADARTARDRLAQYLDGSGAASVKAAIEAHTPVAYHSARVESAVISIMTVGSVDLLAATFRIDIIGSGSGS
jgi:hypothetical protein